MLGEEQASSEWLKHSCLPRTQVRSSPYDLRSGQQDTQSDASSSSPSPDARQRPKRGALRQYVDTFGPDTIQEMARVVSQEAATIIEMQSVALFGDYRLLQEQMEVCCHAHYSELVSHSFCLDPSRFKNLLGGIIRIAFLQFHCVHGPRSYLTAKLSSACS